MIPVKDRNPSDLFPLVTIAVIITNIVVFFYELSQGSRHFQHFTLSFALVPKTFVTHPLAPKEYVDIFTSMFMHGSILHLGGNMLFLWIFGNNVEDYFGHLKFAIFYALCGVVAAFAHIFTHPASAMPTIGASGAISGVLGAYFLLFPRARIVTLVPLFIFFYFIEVPAFVFLGIYILIQVLYGLPSLAGADAQGIAWFAHIGGFFAGILFLAVLRKRRGFRRQTA